MQKLTQPSGKGALVYSGRWIDRAAVSTEGERLFLPWPASFQPRPHLLCCDISAWENVQFPKRQGVEGRG